MTTLVGLLAGYYGVWSRSRFVRLIDALPGPKPLPVLGNVIDILKYTANGTILKLIQLTWAVYIIY
jgi:ABC-type dipeptide/oligopeptide/nickel transport system permease subunit